MVLLVIIVAGSIIVLGISTMTNMSNSQLESQNTKLAQSIQSGMFDVLSVGNNDAVKRQFSRLNKKLSGLNVYVYDRQGKIFFSTEAKSQGDNIKSHIGGKPYADIINMIANNLNSDQMFDTIFHKEKYAVVNMVIPNEEKCFHCHGSSNKVLGGITVCASKAHAEELIDKGVKINLLLGVAGLVILIIFTGLFFNLMVNKKIKILLNATDKMRKRDLTHESVVKGRDEMDHILARINLVNKDLKDSVEQIIDSSEKINDSSHGLNNISKKFLKVSNETANNSNSVASAAEEVSLSLNTIANTMEQSHLSLNTVTSASEDMGVTFDEISKNTNLTKNIIEHTIDEFGK
jgi:methyl-accepting chemotaxis protein